ncbi:MAG: TfuA-like protein [Pseudomonadota bacterium]
MRPIVFIGPTLGLNEAQAVLDAEFRPPAAQGDVYRAAQACPPAIGIIDGYFSGQASVWHKEILWSLSEGIPVYGASSMGALRASELDAFGMTGVGEIYDDYMSGILEDDDEVAVVHAPAELGFAPLSEPMVNVRVSLKAAQAAGVISPGVRADLEARAKEMNYVDRSWERILEGQQEDVRCWLTEHRIDQKRNDALAMLRTMSSHLSHGIPALDQDFLFERTAIWERATRSWAVAASDASERLLFEEAFVTTDTNELPRKALLRRLALAAAHERDLEISPSEQRSGLKDFRLARGLLHGEQFDAWLTENAMTKTQLLELLAEEYFVAEVAAEFSAELCSHALDVLRIEGRVSELAKRATQKQACLVEKGLEDDLSSKTGLMRRDLLSWFFLHKKNSSVPDDLEAFCAQTGVGTRDDLFEIIAREYLYLKAKEESA